MRQLLIIALLLLCLFPAGAQTASLQRKVSLNVTDQPLEKALGTLKRQYGLHFSYANNLIPVGQKVSVSVTDLPLAQVLDLLFKDTDVVYQTVGNQIVLRNDPNKRRESSADNRPVYPPVARLRPLGPPVASTRAVMTVPAVQVSYVPMPPQPDYRAEQRQRTRQRIRELGQEVADVAEDAARTVADGTSQAAKTLGQSLKSKEKASPDATSAQSKAVATTDTIASANLADTTTKVDSTDSKTADKPATDTTGYETRPAQVSFFHPLGTNGLRGGKTVNHFSFNVIYGYAAGLHGLELGGVANVEKAFVKGTQFAGVANIVGGPVSGAQFAGTANVVKGDVHGAQFAGFANITKGSATHGGQFAGFLNTAGGPTTATQMAGFLNIAKGEAHGFQAAGFGNITKGNVDGAQMAGFVNTAADVKGAQISGFINRARNVKGVQIGIVNFADTVSGAQIGILNFSRRGYRRIEVWGSEGLYVNAAFKMGTRQFHSIVAVGFRSQVRNYTAYGFGFGSEIPVSNNTAVNLDLISWQVGVDRLWTEELNMLNQLRANLSFRVAGRMHVFVGPTFNVYLSRLWNAEEQSYGFPLASWNVYDRTHGRTRLIMWPGFNAGIRF